MIRTLLRISWITLRRDRVALLLTFLLPIAFFSIFAIVFGGMGGDGTSRIRVAVADLDQSTASRRILEALQQEPGLRVTVTTLVDDVQQPLDRDRALALVRAGTVPAAVILLPGFEARFGDFAGGGEPAIDLLVDSSDPVAGPMVSGLLQKVAMTAAPDLVAGRGLDLFEKFAGGFTPQQKTAVKGFEVMLAAQAATAAAAKSAESAESASPATPSATESSSGSSSGPSSGSSSGSSPGSSPGSSSGSPSSSDSPSSASSPSSTAAPTPASPTFAGPVSVRTIDVLGESKSSGLIAFYAAGTGVMFLLFSMSGAAGTLLEEQEAGTLERLLSGGMGVGTVIFGKWLFHSAVGALQLTVMFLWGWFMFKLELFEHLGGFVVMTLATAPAAAAFGLLLAGICRTRAQLGAISTVTILIMSAMGGSMFPRFMMPEWVQNLGLVTFNAWALDGYQKVFWYDAPTWQLWPQVTVLLTIAAALLTSARLLARRWEAN